MQSSKILRFASNIHNFFFLQRKRGKKLPPPWVHTRVRPSSLWLLKTRFESRSINWQQTHTHTNAHTRDNKARDNHERIILFLIRNGACVHFFFSFTRPQLAAKRWLSGRGSRLRTRELALYPWSEGKARNAWVEKRGEARALRCLWI